ncbi:MAG: type III pantothenate kinase [Pseudomonadota bacterium]
MIISLDAGNTRIKWGVFAAGRWQAQGALATADSEALAHLVDSWPHKARLAIANVAGASVAQRLHRLIDDKWPQALYLQSSAQQGGVRNGYEHSSQLGADRWAALIGARHLVQGACLIVSAGTATTIDQLDADGVFQGGVILPGYELMRQALAQGTAQLSLAAGNFVEPARNTSDAMTSGCLSAQMGAIERAYRQMPPGATCVLSGGGAALLAPHLALPLRQFDNLVLEGLRYLALEAAD